MVEFFGKIDRNSTGQITSQMPAWYFGAHIEELREQISAKKRNLELGRVPQEHAHRIREEIAADEVNLKEILSTAPTFKGKEKDAYADTYHKLRQQLSDSMPTRREEERGFVNPREELAKNQTEGIAVDKAIAESCGIRTRNGKVTRKDATRMFKMIGAAIGEDRNVERLRKEGHSQSYQDMHELTRMILQQQQKVG